MSSTFEWICKHVGILRLHAGACAVLGDEFLWSATIRAHPPGVAEIKGVDRPLPPGGARAVCRALRAEGFTHRLHERRSGGTARTVVKTL